MLSTVCT